VRPSASFDASAGVSLYQLDRKSVRLQADVFNLLDRLNVIDFVPDKRSANRRRFDPDKKTA